MKKLFMIGMSIILCLVLMAIPVSADFTEGTAAISSATGERGETVYLIVSLSDFMDSSSIGVTWDGDLVPDTEKSEWLLTPANPNAFLLDSIEYDGAMWAVEELTDLNRDVLKLAFVVPEEDDGKSVYAISVTVYVHSTTQEADPVTATGYIRLTCEHTSLNEFPAEASTCTQQGHKQYFQCSACQVYLAADKETLTTPNQEALPLADHVFQWIIDQEASDMAPGRKHEQCENCEEVRNENTPIAILPHTHNPVHVAAIAATCTTGGNHEHWICDSLKCVGKYYTDSNCTKQRFDVQIPALNHLFGSWVVIKAPSASEEGLEKHTCTRCGHAEERAIEKLNNPFEDVSEANFYYAPVLWALENNVTKGVDTTHFGPDQSCNRSQVVTFLWRAVGKPEPTSTKNPFVDVKETDFFYKPVLWALENNITKGVDATHFGPDQNCNRSQVVTFLWRAIGRPEPTSTTNPFVDSKETDFFYKPVLWALENSITKGVDTTHFGPDQICNRGQVVTFLYRTI